MTEKPRNTEAALIEMREAADTLNRWAREYYVLDNPSVSDERYDALYDRLVRLEKTLRQDESGESLSKHSNAIGISKDCTRWTRLRASASCGSG